MRRRAFLRNTASVASVTAIAGCSALGGSSDYKFEDASEEGWETWDFRPQGARYVAGGRFSLEPGQWAFRGYYSSAININLTYDFEITSGNGVEFYIIEEDEGEAFVNQNDPDLRFADQLEGIGSASTRVTTREYGFIVDNTEFGDMGTGGNASSGTLRLEAEPL